MPGSGSNADASSQLLTGSFGLLWALVWSIALAATAPAHAQSTDSAATAQPPPPPATKVEGEAQPPDDRAEGSAVSVAPEISTEITGEDAPAKDAASGQKSETRDARPEHGPPDDEDVPLNEVMFHELSDDAPPPKSQSVREPAEREPEKKAPSTPTAASPPAPAPPADDASPKAVAEGGQAAEPRGGEIEAEGIDDPLPDVTEAGRTLQDEDESEHQPTTPPEIVVDTHSPQASPEADAAPEPREVEAKTASSADAETEARSPRTTVRDEAFDEIAEDAPEPRSAPAPEPAPTPAPVAKDERRFRVWWDRGIRVEGRNENFRLKIGGRLMADIAHIDGTQGIEDRFKTGQVGGVRQARFDFTGTVGKRIYYRLQVDVTGESSTDFNRNEYIKSFFVGVTGLGPLGRAEFGIIKEPVSMGVLTSGLVLDFMERGLPTIFAPSFNAGVVFRNEPFDGKLSWSFGVFRGQGSDGDQNAVDLAGRIAWSPYRSEDGSRFTHLGLSYKFEAGNSEHELRFKARPEIHWGDSWVDTGDVLARYSHVAGLELAGIWRHISFQGELLGTWVDRERDPDVGFWGAYGQVSYFLTGEHRRYLGRQRVFGRVQLNHEFDWKARTWGAFELVGRYSYITLNDDDIRGGTLGDVTLGLNWYLRSNVRLMFNYIRASLNGKGRGNIVGGRFQIDY